MRKPMMSMCASGFSVSLPWRRGVSSPRLIVTSEWANSWTVRLTTIMMMSWMNSAGERCASRHMTAAMNAWPRPECQQNSLEADQDQAPTTAWIMERTAWISSSLTVWPIPG